VTDAHFGVVVHGVESLPKLERLVHRADDLGYDVVAAPDHLGYPAPFSLLTAIAAMSSRMRLRTYMLNCAFWNAALLAREAATLDVLSAGRLELGLGAGHMRSEFEAARIAWTPLAARIAKLEDVVIDVRRRLADHQPTPVQRPLPIAVGAMSRRGLTIAARHADTVGFAGLRQVVGAPAGTFTITGEAEFSRMVDHVQAVAAGRSYRADALLQVVAIDEPESAAASLASTVPGLTVDQVLASPFVLLADSAPAAAAELHRRQDTFGIHSWTTHEANLDVFGDVIAAYRAA
jgi:probable F420-dependent oxidoreductase